MNGRFDMGDEGEIWNRVRKHRKAEKERHDDLVYEKGVHIMRRSMERRVFTVMVSRKDWPEKWRVHITNL